MFAATVADGALTAEALMTSCSGLVATAAAPPPVTPRLAFLRTPLWDKLDPDATSAFEAFAASFPGEIKEAALPDWTAQGLDWRRTILEADLARSFADEYERGRDLLSPVLREMIARGQTHRAAIADVQRSCDAILTPGTTGTPPKGLRSTGSPMFCTLWTLAGVPAFSLPLLKGREGLPLGVQLIGCRGDDARLARTARWLSKQAARAT